MPTPSRLHRTQREDGGVDRRATGLSVGSVGLLVVLTGYALLTNTGRSVVVIGWTAFSAMSLGMALGRRSDTRNPYRLVWGYGLAGGAILTSASLFLLPQAVGYDPHLGGAGVALGIGSGYAAHIIGHRLSHFDLPIDRTTAQITAHALAAGLVIGFVYAANPSLSVILGLAIVSHKGPAGFAAARRLTLTSRPIRGLFLPASGLGVAALFSRFSGLPLSPSGEAILFGFATGIFIHLGMDFLPSCEVGGELYEVTVGSLTTNTHALLDRLRLHAVTSLVVGGGVVFVAWLLI